MLANHKGGQMDVGLQEAIAGLIGFTAGALLVGIFWFIYYRTERKRQNLQQRAMRLDAEMYRNGSLELWRVLEWVDAHYDLDRKPDVAPIGAATIGQRTLTMSVKRSYRRGRVGVIFGSTAGVLVNAWDFEQRLFEPDNLEASGKPGAEFSGSAKRLQEYLILCLERQLPDTPELSADEAVAVGTA